MTCTEEKVSPLVKKQSNKIISHMMHQRKGRKNERERTERERLQNKTTAFLSFGYITYGRERTLYATVI